MSTMQKIEPLLLREGFTLAPNPIPEDIGAIGWAFRKGRMADDYLFLFAGLEVEAFRGAFERARKWANAQYKMPKALRFRVPHTLCVLITEQVDGSLKRFVDRQPSRSVWGGEINHLLVVDPKHGKLHHQLVSTTHEKRELAIYQHVQLGERVLAAVA